MQQEEVKTPYVPVAHKRSLNVLQMRNKTQERMEQLWGVKSATLRASPANSKVGAPNFNLPALVSCVGATKSCGLACYAQKGHYATRSVPSMYWFNWIALQMAGPHKWSSLLSAMVLVALGGLSRGFFRLHSSGDFFSQEYFDAWCEVAKRMPNVRFWAYTRTFSLDMSRRPENLVVYASADLENLNAAKKFAERWDVKIAYMGMDTAQTSGRKHFACPEQENKVQSCLQCGLCIYGRGKDVAFKMH